MSTLSLLGQRWFVRASGTPDRPALLLLHGFTGSHASWVRFQERWSEKYFVLVPDLPGHGNTPTPEDPHDLSMEATADRLAALLDQHSLEKAAVIGYSMGGRLALHMAHRHGKRLSGLVLESASPGLRNPDERRDRSRRDRTLADAIDEKGLTWFVPHWSEQPLFRDQPRWLVDEENAIRASHTAHGLAQSLRGAGTGEQESLWESLPDLVMPVLLVAGRNDKKFAAIAETMAERMPNAAWVLVDQAGHTVHGEEPERFYDIVNRFLSDLPGQRHE